jgi:hypothetical protein
MMKKHLLFALFLFAFSTPAFNLAFAQSTEISPRAMERLTRKWSRMISPVVPRNCNANDPWFMASVTVTGIARQDVKVIKPDGTTYVCKECVGCEGIKCESPNGKPINVAKRCTSDVDGEINF